MDDSSTVQPPMPGPANVSVCDGFSDDARGLRQLIMENDGRIKEGNDQCSVWPDRTTPREVGSASVSKGQVHHSARVDPFPVDHDADP